MTHAIGAAIDAGDPGIAADLNAGLGVDALESPRLTSGLVTRASARGAASSTVTPESVPGGDRSDFEADIAGADDHQPRTGVEMATQVLHVRDCAQVVQPGMIGARAVERARATAGGEQQPVERQSSVVQRQMPGLYVQRRCRHTQHGFDVGLTIKRLGLDEQAFPGQFARQKRLGEGRGAGTAAVARPQSADPAAEALLAQAGCRLRAGLAAAENEHGLGHGSCSVQALMRTGIDL